MIIPAGMRRNGRCHACNVDLLRAWDGNGKPNEYYCSTKCVTDAPPTLAVAMKTMGVSDPRECILQALRSTGSQQVAADMLGMDATVLGRCMKHHHIRRQVVWS